MIRRSCSRAAGADDAGDSSSFGGARSPRKPWSREHEYIKSCHSCHQKKIVCDKQYPCSRCCKLSLRCVPRVRKSRGREATELVQDTDLLGLVVQLWTPLASVQTYLEQFAELHREGKICRDRVMNAMRGWKAMSIIADGTDITWGISDAVGKMLGISPVDIEAHEELGQGMGPDLALRQRRVMEGMSQSLVRTQELKESCLFKRIVALHPNAAIMLATMKDGCMAAATNEAHDKLILSAADMSDNATARRTLPHILFTNLTATEDRAHLRKISLESQFNPYFRCNTSFVKLLDKEGDVHLFIMTFERLQPEDGSRAVVFRTEPVPPSRHLTERPHVNRRVVHKFRDRHVMANTGSGPVSFPLPNDLSDHKNSADDSNGASLSASVDATETEGATAALLATATATATTATTASAAAVGEEKEGASLPNTLKPEEGETEETGIRVSLSTPIATILPFPQLSKEEEDQLLTHAHERGLFRPSPAQQQQQQQQQQKKRQRQKQKKRANSPDDIKVPVDAEAARQSLIVDHHQLVDEYLDYSHLAPSFSEVEEMGLDSTTIEALVEVFGGGLGELHEEQEKGKEGGGGL